MEDPGGREETPPNIELEFRNFDEKDYTSHRNVYISVHMPYGRKHHHRHHHRHRHHKRKHGHAGNGLPVSHGVDSTDHTPSSSGGGVDPTTPINPCDRVKFILGEEEASVGGASNGSSNNVPTCSSRQLFTEMDELCCYPDNRMEWKETARWIQFEEDLEEDADRWSKPHVATLSLRSLFELRSCVLRGSVQLDLDAENLCQIVDLVLDNLVSKNYLEVEYRSLVRDTLLQRHCHHNTSQSSGLGLRQNSSQLHHGDDNSPVLSRQTSISSEMRRNSSFSSLRPIKSLLNSLQLQQQKEEGLAEDAEGVANRHLKVDQHVMRKLPSNAEASNVLVGEVESLPHTVIAFVRLSSGCLLGDLTEVPVPTRFIFVLLGPLGNRARYHEVGRSIATLMSDPVFHDVAYKARCREDLLAGIDEFLDKVTVLPPGEWDPQIRIEPPDNPPSPTTRVATVANVGGESPNVPRQNSIAMKKQVEELTNFQCEMRPFSGLTHDGRRWRSRFLGDLRDALHWNTLAAILFMYFVTVTLVVSLGEELTSLTEYEMGVRESLLASCIANLLAPLFGGQPLIVMAASRSTLVFDQILHEYTVSHNLPFLAFRFWIGLWAVLMLLLLVATNASGILLIFTRFTLELFSVLLSIVFIVFIIMKFWDVHREYIHSDLFYVRHSIDYDCQCYRNVVNSTDNSSFWEIVVSVSRVNCTDYYGRLVGSDCDGNDYKPDVFYVAIILMLGTFLVAWYLRKFYYTPFLTSLIRRIVSKFAVPISMILWIIIYVIAGEDASRLPINSEHGLTQDRSYIVNPLRSPDFELPIWAIFAAIIPAAIVTLLVSVQHLVSIHFINKKLKKGRGYHLDLLVATVMVGVSALLGFPWILAALVPSLAHVDILTILSPGKQLPCVREQRVTGFFVGVLLALSVPMEPFLVWIPLPILYGVLLLVGVASFSNIQFLKRVALLFITDKHKPDCCYVRNIPNRQIHLFTLLQLALLVVLCGMALSPAVLALPVMVAIIVLIRWLLLRFLFSTKHLEILDDPLLKLPCGQQCLSRTRTTQQQPETSHDGVDGVEDSINISVEMEKCDLWRHVSHSEKSPPPTIRVTQPTPHHQSTAV